MGTSLTDYRNYDQGILEKRATLPTLRISAPLNNSLFIIAPYGKGLALYSSHHDFPLSTTLLARAETYITQEGAVVRANTPRLIVLEEDRNLIYERDPETFPIIFKDSEPTRAHAFMSEYIKQCYEAALRAAGQKS
ncbi:hypothetical protein FJZ18_02775 [Candidatus Pacearchaeota archaeon]|nr:hypothetical protein [Candidatus Pacearchaeota archaeon]